MAELRQAQGWNLTTKVKHRPMTAKKEPADAWAEASVSAPPEPSMPSLQLLADSSDQTLPTWLSEVVARPEEEAPDEDPKRKKTKATVKRKRPAAAPRPPGPAWAPVSRPQDPQPARATQQELQEPAPVRRDEKKVFARALAATQAHEATPKKQPTPKQLLAKAHRRQCLLAEAQADIGTIIARELGLVNILPENDKEAAMAAVAKSQEERDLFERRLQLEDRLEVLSIRLGKYKPPEPPELSKEDFQDILFLMKPSRLQDSHEAQMCFEVLYSLLHVKEMLAQLSRLPHVEPGWLDVHPSKIQAMGQRLVQRLAPAMREYDLEPLICAPQLELYLWRTYFVEKHGGVREQDVAREAAPCLPLFSWCKQMLLRARWLRETRGLKVQLNELPVQN